MKRELFKEEILYAVQTPQLCEQTRRAIQSAIQNNHAVGFIAGYYDDALTIAYVSEFFLHNLGYRYEDFMEHTGGSLKNVFCGENCSFMQEERFPLIQGAGEAQMRTGDGAAIDVRAYKTDTADSTGRKLWVLSIHVDQMHENLNLVNQVIRSGFWSIEFDAAGEVQSVLYSHEFRAMLGYHDVWDFPNSLEVWENGLHPEDRERVLQVFDASLKDRTNRTKYNVEYRMRLADGSYEWFRDSAEISRRADGTAYRMAGIFVNINEEKKRLQHTRRIEAFHRAYTAGNLCEYYVDLKNNRFDSLKAEGSLLALHEKNSTWDELVRSFLDTYIEEEDRKALARFYDRSYISRKLAEGKNEISLECRITLNGSERWIRNVVIGDAADGT